MRVTCHAEVRGEECGGVAAGAAADYGDAKFLGRWFGVGGNWAEMFGS